MTNLGWCYEVGHGTGKDMSQAILWYQSAADSGDACGQNNLSICFESGNGVNRDLVKALYWARKAAAQGFEPAIQRLPALERSAGI